MILVPNRHRSRKKESAICKTGNLAAADSRLGRLYTSRRRPIRIGLWCSLSVRPFDLPRYLARSIAEQWGRDDLTHAIRLIAPRSAAKDLPLDRKLEALKGTIEVDKDLVGGKVILLIDDLYQSGTSMNYLGMLLLEAGAKKVFGLACEKTCRNDANPHKGW
ncbi:MAG: hypothetical protein QME76_04815 [Bacillota bacterium]|nr:hypothetical protein [Bacillota bacterium]